MASITRLERNGLAIPHTPAVRPDELPTLVCLHALGSSRHAFDELAARLEGRFRMLALDLPGFGDEAARGAATVEETVEYVLARIAFAAPQRFLLLGHSMGGKIATIVASRVLSGEAPVFGLAGVVLLAGSPPSPEPMEEERREQMIGWASPGPITGDDARTFIDANTAGPLSPGDNALMLRDLERTAPEAWIAWLNRGSEEDWSPVVEPLPVPALIVSGREDGDLGEKAQRELNGPLYPRATFAVVDDAAHLLPLEQPGEVAALIESLWQLSAGRAPAVPRDVAAVIASDRTSRRTRGILARRALGDDVLYEPQVLTAAQLTTLRAVAARVVPQEGEAIDLAARLDAQLAAGTGDGWRNAGLPADPEAYALALDALASAGFEGQAPDEQDSRLERLAAAAEEGPIAGTLSPKQLASWFEDACADLVKLWLAHPASLARVGFDGFAAGGDGVRKQGFQLLVAGSREEWEPTPRPRAAATPTSRDADAPGPRHAAEPARPAGEPGRDQREPAHPAAEPTASALDPKAHA
ncbi:alpha/beta fold hydrolase [Herbiconiux sp. VKM Ac-2851]|uniref:alpha/beta fold hydrolase n=1 Tax=Herbiconiux sp. VKM Ac-2851 TaxID=2739025 RepID=UPI0015653FBA|nr:alpha/beta hydrolase [Herbiconiux sp. VKM Ac-2851]NQX33339.1 alpha/beta hydrolase [Herbiconiux sp. VKM Ac-2851]